MLIEAEAPVTRNMSAMSDLYSVYAPEEALPEM